MFTVILYFALLCPCFNPKHTLKSRSFFSLKLSVLDVRFELVPSFRQFDAVSFIVFALLKTHPGTWEKENVHISFHLCEISFVCTVTFAVNVYSEWFGFHSQLSV